MHGDGYGQHARPSCVVGFALQFNRSKVDSMETQNLSWPGWLPRVLWLRRECPLCTSVEFCAEDSRPLDRALRILAMRRVRCVNCWRRYHWFARVGSMSQEQ